MSRRIVWAMAFFLMVVSVAWSEDVSPKNVVGSKPLRKVLDAFESGRPKPNRIVGGHDTTIEQNPWQVAILAAKVPDNSFAQFCGGSIIAPRWVLTAAHCVDNNTKPEQIEILCGTNSLTAGGKRIKVSDIIVHNQWNPATHDSDIALVHVSEDLGGQIITGPSARSTDPVEGAWVTVTGWGTTTWGGTGKTILQEVQIPFVSRDTCNKRASYGGAVTLNMICAGRSGADSCQGDSGGPASTVSPRRLVGIVSWGVGCAADRKFGVYTRVSQFTDWVNQRTQGAVAW